jgi:hypothetical protein
VDDVEFLAAGSGAGGDDDVLVLEPRRRLPRWAIVLAAVLVAGLVVGVAVARAHHRPHHTAQPSVPTPGPAGPTAAPPPVDVGSSAPGTLALTIAGQHLYVLTPAALESFDMDMHQVGIGVITPVLSFPDRYFTLLYDSFAGSIWIVPIGGRSAGELMQFDATSLRLRRVVPLPTTVASAAALRGEIYLGTAERGLLQLRPGERKLTTVAAARDGVGQVVADPGRNRLIYLTDELPTRVRSWSASGTSAPSAAAGTLTFSKAQLLVVDDRIWAAGFHSSGAVLVRLDPTTLHPVQSADEVTAELGPGTILAAAGHRDFIVRSGADNVPLWCLDGHTGEIDQRWSLPGGVVAMAPGIVVVANAGGLQRLDAELCRG